jgi:1-acyl-sn-glycerol-3-phosphate acyltransferase
MKTLDLETHYLTWCFDTGINVPGDSPPMSLYGASQIAVNIGLRGWFRLRVEGLDNVPAKGGAIIAANHRSFNDILLLGSQIRRQLHFVAKKELYEHSGLMGRLFAWYLGNVEAVPIDRNGASLQTMRQCVDYLKLGALVGVFPEGSRYQDPQVHPFADLASLLARRCSVPVVPVGITGSENRGFRDEVVLRIGSPMGVEGFTRSELTAELSRRVAALTPYDAPV